MRCHICDRGLSATEIIKSPDKKSYEPCTSCMEIIMETAYCDGFVKEEETETELEDNLMSPDVDTLDPDTYRSVYDHCDTGFQEDRFSENYG